MKNAERFKLTADHRRGKLRSIHAIGYGAMQGIRHRPHPIDHPIPTGQQPAHFKRGIGENVRHHLGVE